jgi:hypothetical protein
VEDEPRLFEDVEATSVDDIPPQDRLEALLQDNQEKVQELVRIVGPAAIPDLQLKLLDLRLRQITELVVQAVGNQYRGPFHIEYELTVNQLLTDLVSAARQAVLTTGV